MTDGMRLIALSDRSSARGAVVALGSFDGVHEGHRAVLARAAEEARASGLAAVAFTFSVPPSLGPRADGVLLSTPEEKLALLRDAGIDAAALADFGKLSCMTAEEFVRVILLEELRALKTVCGYDFSFGAGRSGTPETLRDYFGEDAIILPCVSAAGIPVSSSKIRSLLSEGKVAAAAELLGRPYSVSGKIFRGRGDGTRIGFPTVNLAPDKSKVRLRPGVYVSEISAGGIWLPAVTDAGYAPSLDNSGVYRYETHILEGGAEFRAEETAIRFLEFIRPETKFGSEKELRAAIAADVAKAKLFFGTHLLNYN